MSYQHVDPATVSVWRWHAIFNVLVIAIAAAVPLVPISPILAFTVPVALALLGIIAAWVWPRARYRRLTYRVDEHGLAIQDGVLWHSHKALPQVRIQHSDVSQGPLQRRYGVATLKLYTAGSGHTKIELPGLSHGDALALRDALLRRGDTGV